MMSVQSLLRIFFFSASNIAEQVLEDPGKVNEPVVEAQLVN